MNIKLIRLISGEDIVCEFKHNDDNTVLITNPLMLYMQPSKQSDQPKVGLVPWMHYSGDKEFVIDSTKVVVVCEPVEELSRQYDSIYGSGLIVPSSKII
jgi:hypothetical protein